MTDSNSTICIHGLGYIGLPTAAVLANSGYDVYGFDVDRELRDQLRSKDVPLDEQDLERFVKRALNDRLQIVDSAEPADFHLICVPTPYNKNLDKTDLSYVEAAAETISEVLRAGDTVVVESTVPPGTTAQRVCSVIEEFGFSVPNDVLLGYSPETVLPGNTLTELRENDRIVGTVDGAPPDQIVALYDSFTSGNIRTADATTAEFVKLIQNAYRDVNIAFANEVAKLAREFEIDSRRAIAMANNHPRVEILRPGPGVGGHCLPIDPLFLTQGNDIPMLIETARSINDGMPKFVEQLLLAGLGTLREKSITILGVAYKGGVSDTRESPALTLETHLLEHDISEIRFSDPYVEGETIEKDITPLEESLVGADATVLMTDHPEYGALSPELFAEKMQGKVIIDSHDMFDEDRWKESGFEIYKI